MSDLPPTPAQKEERLRDALWLAVRLVWDMGWIIAIPAVAFGFGGAYVDRYLGTSPLFILIGLGLALILSFLGVRRKLKEILEKRF